jgi:hypothetical protein
MGLEWSLHFFVLVDDDVSSVSVVETNLPPTESSEVNQALFLFRDRILSMTPGFPARFGRTVGVVAVLLACVVAVDAGSLPKKTASRSHPPAEKASKSMSISEAAENEHRIRCGVCIRAVRHMWQKGLELRDYCRQPERELDRSELCELTILTEAGVKKIVESACEDLPRTHQALIADHGFDMLPHDSPDHDEQSIARIQTACRTWVHASHDVDRVALLIQANLANNKQTHEILNTLQHTFCEKACDYEPLPPRKMRSTLHHSVERHHDWSYTHAVETHGLTKEQDEVGNVKGEVPHVIPSRSVRNEDDDEF